jgi:beta-lactamase class A
VTNRADDPFAMCSTFKAYASGRVLQRAQLGELQLTDAVTIEAADVVANSPITQPRVGQTMTIAQLCQAALQHSDNTAGNWLLRLIGGPSAVTDFARTLGDDRTRLDRWETELNSAIPGDPRDTSTPRALGAGYERLLTGDALARRSATNSNIGCGPIRPRACALVCRRDGRVPTRRAAVTTAAPTTSASSTVPTAGVPCCRS